jgi:hypothetical protein
VIISTCSFAAYQPGMGAGVRITLGVPRQLPPGRWRWPYLAELAPRSHYFRAGPEKFAARYVAQLDRLADDIETKLGWLAERYDGPLVLCCFERRVSGPNDCHRRRWADWWTERTGQPVPELDGRTS